MSAQENVGIPTPRWPAALLLTLGLVTAACSVGLGLTRDGRPGPGLWPLVISLAMAVTAAVVLVSPSLRVAERVSRHEFVVVCRAVLLLGGFCVLLPLFGVVSATTVAGVAWLRMVERETWRVSLLVPPLLGLAIYGVFVTALGVPLPVDGFLPR